jgi:Uma2 family endonuclease
MSTVAQTPVDPLFPPISFADLPLLYEDDEEGDLGEPHPHADSNEIIHVCVTVHLSDRPEYRVFSNMNFYYHPNKPAYVSPDTMVVRPSRYLGHDVRSYRLDKDGPSPEATVEALSQRSAQQRDLAEKAVLYAKLGVKEYILVDITGELLPERLLLKRLQPDGTWKDERDPDGGVTSQLGFGLIIDADGRVRVLNAASGQPYVRPDEAEARVRESEALARASEARASESEARAREVEEAMRAEAKARQEEARARQEAEEQIRVLQAELERLRGMKSPPPGSSGPAATP